MLRSLKGISLLLLLIGNYSLAVGQTDSTIINEKQLDEVIVKAQQRKNSFSRLTRVVATLSKEDLKNLPVQSIADILNHIAGVDIRSRGPLGVQADISVRGGSFDQVLILLNGVNVTDPQTGHNNLNLPVDISSIQRIEVLQGPGARSFGPNAFSGAINFITTAPGSNQSRASVVAGDFGYLKLTGETAVKRGDFGLYLSANRQQSSGYTTDTDFEINNFYGNFTYENSKIGQIELTTGLQTKDFGAYSFYSAAVPFEYEETKTYINNIRWSKDFRFINLSAMGYWRRNFDMFDLYRYGHPNGYVPNYHRTDVFGGNVKLSVFSAIGKTMVGTELREEDIISNVLGTPLNTPVKIVGTDKYYTNGTDRLNTSAFVEHSYSYKNLFLSAGLMFNHSNDFGSSWYWGADASYLIGDSGLKAFISANQSYRLPTFTDLYYKSSVHNGNANLRPEKAITYEAGISYDKNRINASAHVYRRVGSNIIDRVRLPEEAVSTMQNLTKLNTKGIEISAGYHFENIFLKQLTANYTYQKQDKNSYEYISFYALDYLKYRLSFSATAEIVKRLTLTVSGNYQDRIGSFTNAQKQEIDFKPFFTADARLSYAIKNFTLFVEATNLFDKAYYDIGNVIQPGRWAKGGIAYTF